MPFFLPQPLQVLWNAMRKVLHAATRSASPSELSSEGDHQVTQEDFLKIMEASFESLEVSPDLVIDTLFEAIDRDSRHSYEAQTLTKVLISRLYLKWEVLPSALRLTGIQVSAQEHEHRVLGGLGNVLEGSYHGRSVAIKCLRSSMSVEVSHRQYLKEFIHEVILWSKLRHPIIAPLLGVATLGDEDNLMISPWVPKGDLLCHFEGMGVPSSQFIVEANRLLCQVAIGIEYLHRQGIVHGDIRGANILVDNAGNAVLTDFGSATAVGVENIREVCYRRGAITCRAPELLMEFGEPTFACDVYSFAILGVEVYLKKNPYANHTREHIIQKVTSGERPRRPNEERPMPAGVWSLVKACWRDSPSRRPRISEVVDRMVWIVWNQGAR